MRRLLLSILLVTTLLGGVGAQTSIPCTVQSVGTYADKDARLTVRCNTNGDPMMVKGTAFPIDEQWWPRWGRPKATDAPPPPDPPPSGNTYYTATNGNDNNPGTLNAPFLTI